MKFILSSKTLKLLEYKRYLGILQQTIKDLSPATTKASSPLPYLQDMIGKANLKMKMSEEALEYAIANGCFWYVSTDDKTVQHLNKRFLYIKKDKQLTFGESIDNYNSNSAIEVQFDPSKRAFTTCEPCQL